jgi:methyltransferase-like protein/protein-L-isoaspartate O-methyltransferase
MNSYDEIPYLSRPFRKSHPDRLATIATLHGISPPSVARCRVLELGCGLGDNLLPMAEQLPDARFVGVDGSARQIEMARQAAEAAGLANVDLIHADLRDLTPALGRFDYIIAHGIYSWAPADVQQKILAICGEQLTAGGVAYVSYNCYPGWHLRGTVHHLLRYATRSSGGPVERIRHARRLAESLAKAIAADGGSGAAALKQELELVVKQQDSYLYHEYLAEVNEPIYFHEFMDRAGGQGLQYLADTDFGLMSPANLPQPVKQQLAGEASTPLEREQYLDFIKDRKFRQTLLCRAGEKFDPLPSPQQACSLYVASGARPEGAVNLSDGASTTFRNSAAAMVSGEPLVKAAMLELAERWPLAVSYSDLVAGAQGRLSAGGGRAAAKTDEETLLPGLLLTGFSTSLVELSTQPSAFTLKPSDRPTASSFARRQAESSETVTNRRHESIGLSYFQRLMLRFLDGGHDRTAIVEGLLGLVRDGTLAIHDDGQRVPNGARARSLVTEAVETNLGILARLALLVESIPPRRGLPPRRAMTD